MQLGLVTYMWGADWDLPTLIKNCELTGFRRRRAAHAHKHGVEPSLGEAERREVAKRFADSGVELVGLGSDLRVSISRSGRAEKEHRRDQGLHPAVPRRAAASGVKVRPNGLPKEVPVEKTLEQIGQSLGELAAYGEGYGGRNAAGSAWPRHHRAAAIKTIMDTAPHPGAKVCWNCNPEDMQPAPGWRQISSSSPTGSGRSTSTT